ncbi:hypothetical protein SRABI128_05807 [Microbacterium sp. Bi128]|nr:hypothetical protein SRABI128_05807 [Microbacterium sp. Bi128]
MAPGHVLRLRVVRRDSRRRSSRPLGTELPGLFRPGSLLPGPHAAPPGVGLCIGVLAPPLLDFLLVLGVVETVEHFLRHDLSSRLQCLNGVTDRGNLPPQPVLFLQQPRQVPAQCMLRVRLVAEHVRDRRQPEPQVAQEQDPLQSDQGFLAVVPVAVVAGAARPEQANVVVVTQSPAGGAGQFRDLLNGPVHASTLLLLRGPRSSDPRCYRADRLLPAIASGRRFRPSLPAIAASHRFDSKL